MLPFCNDAWKVAVGVKGCWKSAVKRKSGNENSWELSACQLLSAWDGTHNHHELARPLWHSMAEGIGS